ncbi:MAG: DNA topoisomerase (ATP-hydrolyzing) subunit A [Clostridiales bacterium]|nr:DNA topoisomerase (ATP-hydrolyzing) subunit A [Clostridiales bacterium]
MAKKKKSDIERVFETPAEAVNQPITETIETNYMPYVMTVIVSRAIPEIDGFKPAHRKLLYTMYKMGLMTGARTKSANVVGQTMHLNPHGDASIYETLVRLTRANGALLHPFIDSKGSFGKQYSSDMKYAAPRYTEVKLDKFCAEIFSGIDKNAVDMVDNYDGTMKEPVLLPTTFPNIIVNPNMGIAVGMASNICSFNLAEVCDGTIALLKNPNVTTDDLMKIIKAPDFPGGGKLIYDEAAIRTIYETGTGAVKVRAKYSFDEKTNTLEILEIPYSTTIELILKKLTDLLSDGKLREVTDFRDEIDLSGFKLALDLKRGVDPDKLMEKLYKLTPLEDSFKCNFTLLIDGSPRQLGVLGILKEWIRFRTGCYRRELIFDCERKEERLHLLLGLGKILLDIDKAIKIVRETEKESMVVPNLMEGFSIDKVQAEFIAEIKLRNLNREYILNRVRDIEALQNEIAKLKAIIEDDLKLKAEIIGQLSEIKKKYGQERRTEIIEAGEGYVYAEENEIENYPCRAIMTAGGYFKKITVQSYRMSDEQKLKDGDCVLVNRDAENRDEILFFTDKCQVYKSRMSDFDTTKSSSMGDFVPSKLNFDDGESTLYMCVVKGYSESTNVVFIFENGKGVKIPLSAYETKSNRKKLTSAYSSVSPAVSIFIEDGEPFDIMLMSDAGRAIVISTSQIPIKTTRSSQGVGLMTLKANGRVVSSKANVSSIFENPSRYRRSKLPSTGVILSDADSGSAQQKMF